MDNQTERTILKNWWKVLLAFVLIVGIVCWLLGRSSKKCDDMAWDELLEESNQAAIERIRLEDQVQESIKRESELDCRIDSLMNIIEHKAPPHVIERLVRDYRGIPVNGIADTLRSEYPEVQ